MLPFVFSKAGGARLVNILQCALPEGDFSLSVRLVMKTDQPSPAGSLVFSRASASHSQLAELKGCHASMWKRTGCRTRRG